MHWRNAERAQSAQGRQALFEGEAVSGVDDEQSDEKSEEAESGKIEMKAVGEAVEFAFFIRCDEPKRISGYAFKPRFIERLVVGDDKTRKFFMSIEQALRDSDVDHDGPGRRFGERGKRRKLPTAIGWRLRAFRKIKAAQGLGRSEAAAGT
jgi:hypothetical protein